MNEAILITIFSILMTIAVTNIIAGHTFVALLLGAAMLTITIFGFGIHLAISLSE